jgi:hypothetical protein
MKKNLYFLSITSVILTVISSLLLSIARMHILYESSSIGPLVPYLNIAIGAGAILAGIIIWIAAKKTDVAKIFKIALIVYIVALIFSTLLFAALQHSSNTPWHLNISPSIIYVLVGIFNNLTMIFIWGMINRVSSYNTAHKQYVLLSFALLIASNASYMILGTIRPLETLSSYVLISIAVGCLVILYSVVWFWQQKQLTVKIEMPGKTIFQNDFPWSQAAYILAACTVAYNLFKTSNAAIPNPVDLKQIDYLIYMGRPILITLFWFGFAYWAIAKKSWTFAAVQGARIALISAVVVTLYILSTHNGAMWQILLMRDLLVDADTLLFFPLIQLLYLYISGNDRFRFKAGIELIALPLMVFVLSSVSILYDLVFISMNRNNIIYLQLISITILAMLVFMVRRIGAKLDQS